MARSITAADLPPDLARFAEAQVTAGRFASVEDVLRAGKDALEHEQRRQQHHETKLAAIDADLEEGERSGLFEGDPFASVRAELGLPPRR
jgi:putative addiction module CopG family antidote